MANRCRPDLEYKRGSTLGRRWEKRKGEAKGRNMVAVGGSFVAHDLEDDYVTDEKSTCFNGILGSKKVGQVYRGPYTIFVFLT
jgi:hypothetical protein